MVAAEAGAPHPVRCGPLSLQPGIQFFEYFDFLIYIFLYFDFLYFDFLYFLDHLSTAVHSLRPGIQFLVFFLLCVLYLYFLVRFSAVVHSLSNQSIFIGPRSDHNLPMSVTHRVTTLLKIE